MATVIFTILRAAVCLAASSFAQPPGGGSGSAPTPTTAASSTTSPTVTSTIAPSSPTVAPSTAPTRLSSGDAVTSPTGTRGTVTYIFLSAASMDYMCLHYYAILKNSDNDYSPYITSTTEDGYYNRMDKGDCIKTEVSATSYNLALHPGITLNSSTAAGPNSQQHFKHSSSGLPRYTFTMSEVMKTTLDSRPNAQYDFRCGSTDAVVGTTYKFGESIGYDCGDSCLCVKSDYSAFQDAACSTVTSFAGTQITISGTGWWPPGPGNPTDQSDVFVDVKITLNPMPEASSSGCFMAMGAVGYMVNGVALYSVVDGLSYNSLSIWHNNAPAFEVYDMDVCSGHAAMGQYHHHTYSICLAERLNDDGLGHSPVFGFAVDGYPIYGPWQSSGVLATPCWKTRNYDGVATLAGGFGCGGAAGERSCKVDNEFNPSGVTPLATASYGPSTSQTVYSQSGNSFSAKSGMYYEDYYYDASCYKHEGATSDATLDAHNGHDHDSYGYHYHLTVADTSTMSPVFPYGPGPQFFGCVNGTYCKSSIDSRSAYATSKCSVIEMQNLGKKYYSNGYSCSKSDSTPSMAPSPTTKKSCSVASTASSDACSTDSTDWTLITYICVGIIIGVPLLFSVAVFMHTHRAAKVEPFYVDAKYKSNYAAVKSLADGKEDGGGSGSPEQVTEVMEVTEL